jgi:site-specific recombinase XerC
LGRLTHIVAKARLSSAFLCEHEHGAALTLLYRFLADFLQVPFMLQVSEVHLCADLAGRELSLEDVSALKILHNLAKRSCKRQFAATSLSEEIRFHDLRHTAATLMLSGDVPPKVLSEMLGHADISITLRMYAHVTLHMQQAAVDVMEHHAGAHPNAQ